MSVSSFPGENFSYLQVDRPVLYGAEEFMAKARLVGEEVIGQVLRTSITVEVPSEIEGEAPSRVLKPVSEPIMQLEPLDSLRVILLHRRVLKEHASKLSFGHQRNTFDRKLDPVYPKLEDRDSTKRYPKKDLYDQLYEVSLDFGVDPDELPVKFDRVDIIGRSDRIIVLGLLPKLGEIATKVLHTQEGVCERRLFQQSERVANADGQSDNQGIRFATIPTSVDREKVDEAIRQFQQHMPVRAVLGEPDSRVKDSRTKKAGRPVRRS